MYERSTQLGTGVEAIFYLHVRGRVKVWEHKRSTEYVSIGKWLGVAPASSTKLLRTYVSKHVTPITYGVIKSPLHSAPLPLDHLLCSALLCFAGVEVRRGDIIVSGFNDLMINMI